MLFNKSFSTADVLRISEEDTQLVAEAMLIDALSNEELHELTEAADVCNDLTSMGIVKDAFVSEFFSSGITKLLVLTASALQICILSFSATL